MADWRYDHVNVCIWDAETGQSVSVQPWIDLQIETIAGLEADLDRLQGGQDICVHCGFSTPRTRDNAEIKAHVAVCPEHPLTKANTILGRVREVYGTFVGSDFDDAYHLNAEFHAVVFALGQALTDTEASDE